MCRVGSCKSVCHLSAKRFFASMVRILKKVFRFRYFLFIASLQL